MRYLQAIIIDGTTIYPKDAFYTETSSCLRLEYLSDLFPMGLLVKMVNSEFHKLWLNALDILTNHLSSYY